MRHAGEGDEPDFSRPLRHDPVRREEVRIEVSGGKLHLRTMPLGTYRLEERGDRTWPSWRFAVADPALWQSLLDELAGWAEAELARDQEFRERHPKIAEMFGLGPARLLEPPKLEFDLGWDRWDSRAREFNCQECGVRYLGDNRIRWVRVRLWACSDRCYDQWHQKVQQNWCSANNVNASRARKRAEARAGRRCAHCDRPIEAARSTRRYCSDICRVRAHHERAKADRNQW